MNITEVFVTLGGPRREIQPPYELNFVAGTRNIPWEIYATDISKWESSNDQITRARFEILGDRTFDTSVRIITPSIGEKYFRTDPNVYPNSEPGVLQLKSLWSASGKLRWMNPNS